MSAAWYLAAPDPTLVAARRHRTNWPLMRWLNHVFAACSKRFGGAFASICTSSRAARVCRGARSVRNKNKGCSTAGRWSSKKQTTPLLRLASRRLVGAPLARRLPQTGACARPVHDGRSAASESQAFGKSVSPRRRSVARARPRRHLRHFPRHGWHPAPSEITHNMPATPPQRPRTGALTRAGVGRRIGHVLS